VNGYYDLTKFLPGLPSHGTARRTAGLICQVLRLNAIKLDLITARDALIELAEIDQYVLLTRGQTGRDDDLQIRTSALFRYAINLYYRATDGGSTRGHFDPIHLFNIDQKRMHATIRAIRSEEVCHVDALTMRREGYLIDDRLVMGVSDEEFSLNLWWRRKNYKAEIGNGLTDNISTILPELEKSIDSRSGDLKAALLSLLEKEPSLVANLEACRLDPKEHFDIEVGTPEKAPPRSSRTRPYDLTTETGESKIRKRDEGRP